jgi:excinuclease ABC subunit A
MRTLLEIRGAREHNLRGLDLDLPRDGLIGLAGVSGSGKSSLAIDTLFREGQRRYLQTLSPRARRFAAEIDRADVERLDGLRPAIAVDQRARAFGRRSSVATLTEIHELLAALFARFGVPHCPRCDDALAPQSSERIAERICTEATGRRA